MVVTGVGLVTCLGVGTETVWHRLLDCRSGLTHVRGKGYDQIPCKVVGYVPHGIGAGEFNREVTVPSARDRGVSQAAAYALAAAEEALTSSGWKPQKDAQLERTGVCIGTGMVSLEDIVDAGEHVRGGRYRKVSPWFIPEILINIAAGHVSLAYGFKGPNHTVSTACTTGLHAIGDAARFICHGDADVMLAGGAESCVGPLAMAGFARMRALSTSFNDSPQEASRPFDAKRDGFVMSEGAGLLVLEELNHSLERGANIIGEILGYGLSGDAHHLTSPSSTGDGAYRCMRAALCDADLDPCKVGHVNAHATSTPLGDTAESRAILQLLDRHAFVTSTKGALGHLLGAAGSVEAILTLLACQRGQIPPTLNLLKPDTGCDLNYVRDTVQDWPVPLSGRRIALTNSFGFGGTNASICVAQFTQ